MTCPQTDGPGNPGSLPSQDASIGLGQDGDRQASVEDFSKGPASHLETAVDVLRREKVERVLVLDYSDGAAAVRLHGEGFDVVCVDCGSRAVGLARAVLRAPGLEMVISNPAAFAAQARSASFDAVFADVRDGSGAPAAYLSADFWEDIRRLLRSGGLILAKVTDELPAVGSWGPFQSALASAGFTAMVVSERYACGARLLATSRAR